MIRVLLAACLLLGFAGAAQAGKNDADERIDALLAKFDDTTPGVVIGVVRQGELVFARSAGMANLSFGVPFTETTPTNIGSTAKQFTGLALALLHERGELSLDDDIRDHFPELPDFGESVTLRHLATHTSGYREFINALVLAGVRIDKGDWIDVDHALDVVQRQPELQNRPGEEWNYNNSGYILLAQVISRVTGKPFDQALEEEIFQPLEMSSTRVRTSPNRIVPGGSTGYAKDEDEYVEARDIGGAVGAGGVYTTVADMARWMGQLATFELGGEGVAKLMTTPFVLNEGESTNYGLGLIIDEWRGLERWQHGGGDIGHLSVFNYFPELKSGFMVFANHHGVGAELVNAVAEIFFGDDLEAADEAEGSEPVMTLSEESFSDALFDRYAGRYELEVMPGFVLHFFRDQDRYMIQATGQPALEVTPVAADTFTIDVVDARIVFHVEDDGQVNELTLFQNGEHRAVRLPDEADKEAIDPGVYAGRYFSEELETFYTLKVEDGQLQLHHRRFAPVALHATGEDSFSGSYPVFNVDFERDGEGRITALRAGNMRARDIRFERMD